MPSLLLILSLVFAPAYAETSHGTGKNFEEAWNMQPDETYQGTGNNFELGWKPDASGGYFGTGKNYGQRWAWWISSIRLKIW